MAENDIYDSKGKFESFRSRLNEYLEVPTGKRKYQIKSKGNLKYFNILFNKFEARDISFIRRMRLMKNFMIINHVIKKDLKGVSRDDIDKLMAYFNNRNFSPKTKRDFVIDLKFIWKQILPEKDEKGRIDETLIPYAVRHVNGKVDRSREKLRGDRFSIDEFEKLISAFSDDVRMQALLTLALESLARPQELLYVRIKDVEVFDNYAKIWVSEHGKEGTKFLRSIDSFRYVAEWYTKHPLKKDLNAFFFITTGNRSKYEQLTPSAVNKKLREKCSLIGLRKPLTFYSLKRNGVTIRRLRGDSDVNIQHIAGWTSTKQLKTYDLSNQEDSFKLELVRRGIVKPDKKFNEFQPLNKKCIFCGFDNGLGESICANCKRPLDREIIENEMKGKEEENRRLNEKMNMMENAIGKLLVMAYKDNPSEASDLAKKSGFKLVKVK